jgi:radical SAM protein with 4Fe4S-binding SPASM domain
MDDVGARYQSSCGGASAGGILLQWHITDRCNLRCRHCYQEGYSGDELTFPELLEVVEQFKDLLERRGHARGHVTVTGGEPFVRADFLDLLDVLAGNRERFSFAILTNGSFVDRATARRLRALGPAFVQVSLEGARVTHERIRGRGDFDRVVSAVKHLVRERVRTLISFTAHKENVGDFPAVARLGRRLGVSRVWADRLIPSGSGERLGDHLLTPDETRAFFEVMRRERAKAERSWFGRTEIAMHRALQFLVGGGAPYECAAGDRLLTVMPNGDVYPCRRMPIRVGNLMETPLTDLYDRSGLLVSLREPSRVNEGCDACAWTKLCRGGLRCLAYAVTGDPFQADPGCWKADRPVVKQ